MPRFRIAIPAVVAVDIDAPTAEAGLAEARARQVRLAETQDHPAAEGEQLAEYGENAALWAAGQWAGATIRVPGARRSIEVWGPEIWDEDMEEPMPTSDPRHPSYDGPSDEQREAMAERADYAREAERQQLRDAGRLALVLALLGALACSSPAEPEPPDIAGFYALERFNGAVVPAWYDGRRDGCEGYYVGDGLIVLRSDGHWRVEFQANHACGGAMVWPHPTTSYGGTYTQSGDALTLDGEGEFRVTAARVVPTGIWIEVASALVDTLEFVR